MAETARRARTYQTYGNVAYQPRYDGSAVRVPRRQEQEQPVPQPRPQVQPRRQVRRRPQVEVRQAEAVAPFAIAGFLAVALCALLLVISCAELAVVNDQTVKLRKELTNLVAAETALQAEYEMAYDLTAMEKQLTADGSMVRMEAGQITYLDISAPDNIIVYNQSGQGLQGIWEQIVAVFREITS